VPPILDRIRRTIGDATLPASISNPLLRWAAASSRRNGRDLVLTFYDLRADMVAAPIRCGAIGSKLDASTGQKPRLNRARLGRCGVRSLMKQVHPAEVLAVRSVPIGLGL
jgi:hypothetical protein